MTNRKILILDDCPSTLKKLKLNIKKFDVESATTLPLAMKILLKGDISFIVVDMKLKQGKKGQEIFTKLFKKGMDVPGIVFTAYEVKPKTEISLKELGVLKIIPKLDRKTKLHTRIENAATQILKDRKKRFHSIKLKIDNLGIESEQLTYEKETVKVSTWLKRIFDGKYTIEKENKIKNAMVQLCNEYLKPEGSNPNPFPQLGI